jgi:hypothetical protein
MAGLQEPRAWDEGSRGQAGDGERRGGGDQGAAQVTDVALDQHGLGGVREQAGGNKQGTGSAGLVPAVAPVPGEPDEGDLFPRQGVEGPGLVVFDRGQRVVRVLVLHDEPGCALLHVRCVSTEPASDFALRLRAPISLDFDLPDQPDGTLTLPAGAWLRLVVGRLPPQYTPTSVVAEGVADLDLLRQVFPGY